VIGQVEDSVFIDSHAHLDEDQFATDVHEVIDRANGARVARIVNIGYSPERWRTTIGLAQKFACVSFTLGLHPSESDRLSSKLIDELGTLAETSSALAIGEVGLDLFRDGPSLELQRRSFEAQLILARELGLPVVIHQRAAEHVLLEVLQNTSPDVKCILHSFEGSQRLVDFGLERGYYFGIGGLMTRHHSEDLREVIRQIPIDRMLLETDSPYLLPAGVKGRRNEPANIPVIAKALSDLLEVPVGDVADTTTKNAIEIFRLVSTTPVTTTMM
jgi:TatD DNase family protein